MASTDNLPPDPLILLRRSVSENKLPVLTSNADPSSQAQSDVSLAQASFLIFNFNNPQDGGAQHISIPLTQSTRFASAKVGGDVDVRAIFWAWQNKDKPHTDYIFATQGLNEELGSVGRGETAESLSLAEKLDLATWLAGDIPENGSEYIKSLDDNKANRAELENALNAVRGDGDVTMRDAGEDDLKRREEEERLREIYAAERKMGDHNTVLRGVKIQDFSGVRKYSALFLGKAKPAQQATLNPNPALRPQTKPSSNRRPEPIILLSPSASSLLRMGNIKPFLEDGTYTPQQPGADNPSMLAISRLCKSIYPDRPLRFLLLDDTSNFRPDYWNRVVAVFTTGQTWQFKNYKWQNPAELFSHALGVYVGWRGEVVPDTVRGWGRQVLSVQLDQGSQRWRDREVVEDVWSNIESRMRALGWGKEGR